MKTSCLTTLLLLHTLAPGSYVLASESDVEQEDDHAESDSSFLFEMDIDVETSWETLSILDQRDETEHLSPEITLNLMPSYALSDSSRIFLDYELESDEEGHGYVKELYLETEWPEWELKLGRQTLPVSDSEGEFINDNFYEFAETHKTALLASHGFDSGIELSGYVFDSEVDTREDAHELDAGMALSFTSEEELLFVGLGYLSDLSEVLEPLVEIDEDTFLPRTPVLSSQLYITTDTWRIMLEHIQSADELAGAEPGFMRPRATSLEAFLKSDKRWLVGGRYQISNDVPDAPIYEYGITARWWMDEQLSVGVEYVHGKFDHGLAGEEEGAIRDNDIVTIEFTLEL